jgi:hypothetical protein
MTVEKEYADVLQNIEAGIVSVWEDDPALLDLDVLDGLEASIRLYSREAQGRNAGRINLHERARRVFEITQQLCEWRLGRAALNLAGPQGAIDRATPVTVSEVLLCLKRIRASVRLWSEEGGRQGYLQYVRQFLAGARRAAGA